MSAGAFIYDFSASEILLAASIRYVFTLTIVLLFPGLEAVGELCCDVTGFGCELLDDDVKTIGGPFCSAELLVIIPSLAGAVRNKNEEHESEA